MTRRLMKSMQVTVTVPKWILEDIDEIAKDVEISRSEVISDILRTVLKDKQLINRIYPEEDGEKQKEDEIDKRPFFHRLCTRCKTSQNSVGISVKNGQLVCGNCTQPLNGVMEIRL